MSDLKTNFTQPVFGNLTDMGGDLPTARGNDPNISLSGASALQTTFDRAVDPSLDGTATANSVSGLPPNPQRFQPVETPPEMPSLQDRMPGTVDKQ